MQMTDPDYQLKFPIGPFVLHEEISEAQLSALISTIENAPASYRSLLNNCKPSDLAKTYREGSWTVQQVLNHLTDMQLLHYFRMKKALTEKDYKEITLVNIDDWARTPDTLQFPIEDSLSTLETVTKRFVMLMKSLTHEQLDISYYHPVRKMMLNQRQAISMTAWHVQHHLAHIKNALSR